MTLQTWILIAAVFGAVVVLRLGRHRYTRRPRLLTLVVVAVLAGRYVRGMPTSGHDLVIEIACAALGALFGFAMLAVTSVTRDRRTGEIWIRAGLAYLALWTVMLGSRVVFAYTASDWERAVVARFFASHQLTGTAVTPAFVLMTIASLVIVMSGTALRARSLGGSDAGPRDDAGQVPQPTAADARTLASGRPQTLRGRGAPVRPQSETLTSDSRTQ